MNKKNDILSWIDDSIYKINNGANLCDIHIDKIEKYDLRGDNSVSLGIFSVDIFNAGVKYIATKDIIDVQFELHIELESRSNKLAGVPSSFEELLGSIECMSMPELLIFKPEKRIWIPSMEYYTCPLPYQIFENQLEDIYSYYSEYRSMNEMRDNYEFSKWVTLGYLLEN